MCRNPHPVGAVCSKAPNMSAICKNNANLRVKNGDHSNYKSNRSSSFVIAVFSAREDFFEQNYGTIKKTDGTIENV